MKNAKFYNSEIRSLSRMLIINDDDTWSKKEFLQRVYEMCPSLTEDFGKNQIFPVVRALLVMSGLVTDVEKRTYNGRQQLVVYVSQPSWTETMETSCLPFKTKSFADFSF